MGSLTLCIPLSPEPSVVFAKEQPARSEVQAVAGASATLSCEVAQAQTEVTWYKDGKKLSSSSKVRVEAKGCTRQLVVQQAGKADAGEYSCEAGGQKVSFHLDVTGECQGWVGGCECGGCWDLWSPAGFSMDAVSSRALSPRKALEWQDACQSPESRMLLTSAPPDSRFSPPHPYLSQRETCHRGFLSHLQAAEMAILCLWSAGGTIPILSLPGQLWSPALGHFWP